MLDTCALLGGVDLICFAWKRAELINGITIDHRITVIYSVFTSIADQLDLEPETAPIDSWHLLSFSETDCSILGKQLFED